MKQTKFKDLAKNKMAQEKMGWVNPALSKERAVVKFPSANVFQHSLFTKRRKNVRIKGFYKYPFYK